MMGSDPEYKFCPKPKTKNQKKDAKPNVEEWFKPVFINRKKHVVEVHNKHLTILFVMNISLLD